MSPILVRPVREQLEHDRVIRLLQAKFRRRYEVGVNVGAEQAAPLGTGPTALFPDLILTSPERRRRVEAVIEVETSESVNNLEAMGQWARLAQARAPFHLYVPAGSVDPARRYCAENGIPVAELWTYHTVGDQIRFTMVQRAPADTRHAARTATRQQSVPVRKTVARGRAKAASRARKTTVRKPVRTQKRK